MRTNPRSMTASLDWPGLVEEALRRRRAEGLTQKEHAALARVSVPTMIAFDRKETSLSLNKALDILQVVSLVADQPQATSQQVFVDAAEQRWAELTRDLPIDAPARQPYGHYVFDYEIVGASARSVRILIEALRQADRKYSGWPPFWWPTRKGIAPYPFEGGVECWLGKPDTERAFDDAAHSDFWRATVDARLYLHRGYQEDSADVLTPATVFDLTLPIWRAGEVLMHARHLAESLGVAPDAEARVGVRYVGLAGRVLKSWANPHRELLEDYRCRTGEAAGFVSCHAYDIGDRLPELVCKLMAPVYEQFDFFQLPAQLVEEELDKLRKGRVRRGGNQ